MPIIHGKHYSEFELRQMAYDLEAKGKRQEAENIRRYLRQNTFTSTTDISQSSDNSSFLLSMAVAAATDSTLMGAAVGGDFLGAAIGDAISDSSSSSSSSWDSGSSSSSSFDSSSSWDSGSSSSSSCDSSW